MLDPRDQQTLVVASSTGHLGPTIFRSTDAGSTWQEAKQPPAFRPAQGSETPRSVSHTFWLTPGHADELGVWWAGTSPQALWTSTDGGDTWQSVDGFNEHPDYEKRTEDPTAGTPDGPVMHSILIDPRDADHMYLGLSGGGVYESRDHGATWSHLNNGLETTASESRAETIPWEPVGPQHDPHCVQLHPFHPDILYQQNHCGIYRIQRPDDTWERIGRNMPDNVGDIGFVMGLHPEDADTCWVFPMDGSDVWPRTSPGGGPAVYRTRDAGASWERQNNGLPKKGWYTVKRQGMCIAGTDPVSIFFGTTSGELWASRDEGRLWTKIASHLPEIYAVEVAEI